MIPIFTMFILTIFFIVGGLNVESQTATVVSLLFAVFFAIMFCLFLWAYIENKVEKIIKEKVKAECLKKE